MTPPASPKSVPPSGIPEIDFRAIDTLLAVTTISFDIAGLELFLPLVSGGRVVMASRAAAADGMALAALLDQHQVTVLQATPSTWRLLVESGWRGKSDLRALTGGEALPPDLARSLTQRARVVWNVYGPTETTIWSSIYRVTGEEDRTIPIGRPIANTQFHVLDARQEPVPAGYFGELYIGGDGLARGYLNRPEQTAERFVTCPIDSDSQRRLYRTGDLVRHLPDGLLEFQGRLDQQVKVRGFRIELGDIEAALTQDPAIASAAVVVLQVGGENELAAFIVARAEESVRAESLRDSLGRVLPGYMVPSRFYTVDALPLTPNGKVDRRALANRGGTELTPSSTCEAPRTEAERELAELWKAVLRRDRVGIHDNFFALGGHSLLALQLLSRMRAIWSCDVPMRLLFDFPTIAELAARRPHLASSPSESPSIPLVAAVRNGPLPVSPTQERLWFLDRLDPESTAYLIADAIHLTGALDMPALERALREIIVRHESLRTVFRDTESGAIQVASPIPDTVLEYEDLSGLDTPQRASAMATRLDKATGRRFDLAQGPLYRFQLLQLAPEEHLFLITLHHMVADGWSLGIFNLELGILYSAFRDAKPSPLPPLPFQYADYAVWQRSRLQGDPLKRLLEYWTRRLDGAPPLLELPLDGPRIRSGRARAAIRTLTLPTDLSTAILGLSQRSGVTPFMLLLAAFKVLLSRLSGQHDIVVGTPIAGRTQVATEPMIGFFVSTIALRTDLTGNPSFRGLLERVRTTVLEAQEHQDLPFEKLIERLQPDRTAPHNPVFQVLFNLINFENDLPALGQLGVRRYRQPEPDAKFDLTLYVMSQPGCLGFQASYPTHLFHDATIERILEQLKYLLEQLTREPEAAIQGLSLIRPADLSLLPNATAPLPAITQPAIHEAVQTQARRYPQRLAVSDPHHQWTYGELETASNRLANHLLASGLRRGETVAVFAISSVHLAQSLLGILKAGGVFLVLDAAQPEARLRRMLDQSQPSVFLHVEAGGDLPKEVRDFAANPALRCSMALPSGLPVNAGDEAPPLVIGGDDPAYVVFTSGSTGQPLGILGNHGPVSHFLRWHLNRFQLAESDRFSLLSGPGHDPLLRDLFAPLWAGASVHIPPTDIRQSPRRMQSWFEEQGITVSHLTPALAQVIASVGTGDTPRLQSVRWMFLAGDRLTGTVVHALRQCVPRSGIVNFYGTTETPQAMAHHVVVQPGEDSPISIRPDETVPLGRPIDDVQLLLINPAGQLAGIGELAEIGIRTPYLGRSYLGSDELSRTRFILNPFTGQASDRVYRTGDWGRYRLDGTVEFVGRMDGQIKVRGYRVEPDEVARALRQHPAVQDCTVTGGIELGAADSIVAYLLLRNDVDRPDRSQLRAFLKAVLPEAMIPARFLVIEAIPLTPNGKVDRRLLSRLRAVELETGNAGVSPRTETERQMLDVWREALGRPAAGIHDNFFELGGHSLLALRLVTLLHERLHLPITLADLFAHPTVAELASPDSASKNSSSARVFRGKGDGAPWFHIPGVYGLEFLTPSIADQVGRHRRFYDGLQFPGLDGRTEPVTTVPAIADSLVGQINTLWPEGPLCLSGYSMGGLVAYEVAQQLQAAGRTVERLILFDTRLLYLARRKSVPQQLKVLLQRFRDEPAQRRWSWLRDLLRAKFLQHGRRLARRLGSGPRNQQERMEIAGWTASAAYRPEPYSGKVTLLRSTRMGELDSGAWERDAVNGWGPFLHPSFEIRNIDCDHERTFLDPVSPEVLRVVEELVRPLA